MTVMKRGLVGVCVMGMLLTAGAAAQGRVTTVGVLGGATFATVAGDDADEADTKVGLAIGGYVSFGLSRNIAIETGAMYSQRGAKATEGGVTAKFKLDYIEVPLLLSVRFPGQGSVTPFFSAGPALGVRVGCGLSVSGGGTTLGTDCSDLEDELGGEVKSTDVGLVGTVGVDVKSFRISASYSMGLSTIIDASPSIDLKNRVFSLLVGYGFRMP